MRHQRQEGHHYAQGLEVILQDQRRACVKLLISVIINFVISILSMHVILLDMFTYLLSLSILHILLVSIP